MGAQSQSDERSVDRARARSATELRGPGGTYMLVWQVLVREDGGS